MNSKRMIPLASPDINDNDIVEVIRVLKSGMLVQGIEVEQLEKLIASFVGVEHCVAVANGTATMHLGLIAMGIGPGDEVIVPAFSYIATANVVELVGATPVFVDIDLETFNIKIPETERAISPKTKAIIAVHEFGLAADIEKLKLIGEKYKVKIIEDAACALGASHSNKLVGSFGDMASFSLHPRKAISSGEGGLITTNNDDLAQNFRILRNHGIHRTNGKTEFVAAGFNYRMTDFQAALAKNQFLRLDKILSAKRLLAQIYFEEICNPLIQLPSIPSGYNHSWQTFHVLLADGLDQGKIIRHLKSEGIETNYGAQCIPYQTFFANKYRIPCGEKFPNALKAFKQGIALPIYEKLTVEDVKYISQKINELT